MSRLIVPRGNGVDPPLPVYPLDRSSPRWGLLRPDEQQAATSWVFERPVMRVTMASRTLWECLGDARRAPTGSDWEVRRDRLRRVKVAVFGGMFEGRDDDETRQRWQVALQSRLILLHAPRDAAEVAASDAIAFVLRCKDAGEVPPPRFGTYAPKWGEDSMRFQRFHCPSERAASQQVWDAESALLIDGQHLVIRESLDDELRAFAPEPPLDEFLLARGERIAEGVPSCNASRISTHEDALRHVTHVVSVAQAIVSAAKLAASGRSTRSAHELGENAYRHSKSLYKLFCEHAIDKALLLDYSVHRDAPFEFPAVIKPTVHEAAVELARLVGLALRAGVEYDAPWSLDYDVQGPWEGSEVAPALLRFAAGYPELCDAFDPMSVQRLEAELVLEARHAIARRDSASKSRTANSDKRIGTQLGATRRGRRGDYDPVLDRNIAASKKAGSSLAQLAKEHGKSEEWVLAAIKRAEQKVRDRDRPPRRK